MEAVAQIDQGRRIVGEGTTEAKWRGWPGLDALESVSIETCVPAGARAVVVAPHPDDEVLAVGGLLERLARRGQPIRIIAVTDGGASHRGSLDWPVERLLRERPKESRLALQRLGIDVEPIRLGLPDGALKGLESLLAGRLRSLLSRSDVVFTTWRRDGHPDHEATGHACACAVRCVGARLLEVPVWAWHWATPGDARLPWARARRFELDAAAAQRKQHALEAFASQLQSDASTGNGPVLRATVLERAARRFEVLFQ
jgi:LmbE family N-acetylglucosaminyl deacetylase